MWPFAATRPSLEVRQVHAAAARECAAIHQATFPFAWSVDEFERLLAADNIFADGAFNSRSATLFGFALSRASGDEAELLSIAIDPRVQRYGFGAKLLQAHLAQAEKRGIRTMFLEVEEANVPALTIYRRLGFAEVGKRVGYYRKPDGSKATALVLRRNG